MRTAYIKVKSTYNDGCVSFDHFEVVKIKHNIFAVYRLCCGYRTYVITHGTTLRNACKKAKLLEIGYQERLDE